MHDNKNPVKAKEEEFDDYAGEKITRFSKVNTKNFVNNPSMV